MKNLKIIFIISILCILTFNTQINCQIHGRMNLMNHSFPVGSVENIPDNFISNSAKLFNKDSTIYGLSVSPSNFGLSELNSGNIFIIKKINEKINIGSILYGMGGNLYNEFSLSSDIAYSLDDKLHFGTGLEVSRLTIKDFNSNYSVLWNLGAIIKISEKIYSGISMLNLLRQTYSEDDKTTYQRAIIGIAANAMNTDFEIAGVINLNHSSGFVFGISKKLFNSLNICISVATEPQSISFGIDYFIFKNLNLNINILYHQELGLSQRLILYNN